MTDYRPQNRAVRMEYLAQYYYWSLKYYDCDPALFMLNYIHDRMELNIEQRYWIAWLYGNTYHLPTAWVIANEFPDFENVDQDRLEKWNAENYKRLRYQSDQKWQKGHLPKMFASYKENIAPHGSQEAFFKHICTHADPEQNFGGIYDHIVKHFYKFGRYSAWFYIQTLKETCGLNVAAPSLLLHEDNTHAQRAGLLYALGRDEAAQDKKGYKDKLLVVELEAVAKEFLSKFTRRYPDVRADMFSLETTLCAFKKTFREKNGRYLGYYLDRQRDDIVNVECDGWGGIDWSLLWAARRETLPTKADRDTGVDKSLMAHFLATGEPAKIF